MINFKKIKEKIFNKYPKKDNKKITIKKDYSEELTLKMWDGEARYKIVNPDGTINLIVSKNKVLIGGLQLLVSKLWGTPDVIAIEKFEDDLYTQNNVVSDQRPDITPVTNALHTINGFNVVFDGAIGEAEAKYPRHKKGYNFDNLIPFRMVREDVNRYENFKDKYLHSRIVTLDGINYVQYFTKKSTVTVTAVTANGDNLPDNPDENFNSDADCRMMTEFDIVLDSIELTEWFGLYKQAEGGSYATAYNGVITMIGKAATIPLMNTSANAIQTFDTMTDTLVFTRVQHVDISNGIDSDITGLYKTVYI